MRIWKREVAEVVDLATVEKCSGVRVEWRASADLRAKRKGNKIFAFCEECKNNTNY